jgi:soluble lytic murein transglycosylase
LAAEGAAVKRRGGLALVALAAASACGGEVRGPLATNTLVPLVASALPSTLPSASAPSVAPVVEGEWPAEVPHLSPTLADTRLTEVEARTANRDWLGAATALTTALSSATLTPPQTCAWRFALARLRALTAPMADVAAAYDSVAPSCALAPYASFRAGQAYARLGRWDEAVTRARAVPDGLAVSDDAKLGLAEALAAKGDRGAAVAIWRARLASSPTGAHWVETAARLASALLDGADGPAATHAKEAFDLATRIVVEAPGYADSSGATASRASAVALLRTSGTTGALSLVDRARRAHARLDAGDSAKALAEAEVILATIPKSSTANRDVACDAAVVRARAATHASGSPADAWGDAIARCDGEEPLAAALYSGGKASASAHRYDEASQRFAKLEQTLPTNHLADDAHYRAALAARDGGDDARFVAQLTSLPDLYPDGDMRSEALFQVALYRLGRGENDLAKAVLDKAVAVDPHDHAWQTAGRAAYFRARVAQITGDVVDAKGRYAKLITDEPLAFYMTQAYARLDALDSAAAKAALADALAREPTTSLISRPLDELTSAPFDLPLRLLEAGEFDAARRELATAGELRDTSDEDRSWAFALLFDSAGAPDIGHSLVRGKLRELFGHYPTGHWKFAWEAAYPRAFDATVTAASAESDIPTPLTWAIMREESGFLPSAKSHANAIGLMQLLPSTARSLAKGMPFEVTEESLELPSVSISIGAKLLASLRRTYTTNHALAIAAYNCGTGNVKRWLDARGSNDFDLFVEQIPFDETRGYVKRVLATEAAYAFLYAHDALPDVLAIPTRLRRPDG